MWTTSDKSDSSPGRAGGYPIIDVVGWVVNDPKTVAQRSAILGRIDQIDNRVDALLFDAERRNFVNAEGSTKRTRPCNVFSPPQCSDGAGIVEHYYLQDANFNVTAVVDNAGTVKERYAYTPYGEVTILDDLFTAVPGNVSTISNEHLYTGRRLDPETGLQLNRNRFYASHLGRWINRDPIGYLAGYNLYEYTGGMPTYYVDPSGLVEITCRCSLPWAIGPHYDVRVNCSGLAKNCCKDACGPDDEMWDWRVPKKRPPQKPMTLPPEPPTDVLMLQGIACGRLMGLLPPIPGGGPEDPTKSPDYIPAEDPEHIFSDPKSWPKGWTPGGGFFDGK